ncbi:bifunctional diguanylate cyclase/phosphodiesterase [Massilia sp. BJB1822]|uniref:putative bifunctional diguanylate cyclase/phosphodiesterase n=1 Tax=Massilia sp. BJB1822 TaxID=2744470 RepID=UPI00159499EA|nr:EAL domain-containing protein [Massilia sp. BJB1822]NVD99466.1 EAL domain-containing protein [Massilia sp. BJB1822]
MDEEQQAAPDGLRPAAAYAGPNLEPVPGLDLDPYALLATSPGPVPLAATDALSGAARFYLEREQGYFNDIYLLAPVGYFVLALDTTVLLMNLVGADLLGIPRANPQRLRLRGFIAQRFLPDFDAFVSAALNSREPQRCQVQMTRGRGDRGFPVTLLASGSGDGQSFRVVLELAEGKLAALERSEERFRRIVHNAEEGIWEVDAAARTSFVNPKMAQMLGYTIEEMLEQPLQHFMDEEGRTLFERNIASRLQGVAERHDFKFRRKSGEELWASLSTNPIFDGDGAYLGALALVTDITAQRHSSEEVWRQANFDALTGLPNRHMFQDRLGQEMKKAKRDNMFLALLFIDLDQFKEVNDRLGHAMGDRLLAEAAGRIAACVRASDTLARLGGDEFVVILPGLEHAASVERVAQNIITALNQPFQLAREQGRVSASVGIALFPSDAAEPADLLSHADQAMYAAKSGGRNRYCYFTADMQAAAQQRLRLSGDLRRALDAGEFQLYYQPIVNLRSGRIERAEALLRWHHPQRGTLNPPEFIGNAEASGLIVDIGDWVFRQAADQAQAWQRELGWPLQISVNQSPVQFRGDPGFCQGWLDYVNQLQLAPRSIVIEITESILTEAAGAVLDRLRQFRAMGLQVALDDFGTGHGSLAHLKQFELDYLKIDRSFVQGLSGDSGGLALCEAIIVMAHKLGLQVVAEGVESEVQLALLQAAGCDYAQGFVYAHAMPPDELAAMIQREAANDSASKTV